MSNIAKEVQCQLCIEHPEGDFCDCKQMKEEEIEAANNSIREIILNEDDNDEVELFGGKFILGIDPGHEGTKRGLDPGAVGFGLAEADVVLAIAKEAKKIATTEYHNVDVVMTREADKKHTVYQKGLFMNNNKVSYSVSIHNNSFRDPKANGYEDFTYNGPVYKRTLDIQKIINAEMSKALPELKNRGAKRANLGMVRTPNMPAILLEVGFISNKRENDLMRDKDFINRAARGLMNGVARAFKLSKRKEYTDAYKEAQKAPQKPKEEPKVTEVKKPTRDEVANAAGRSLKEDVLVAFDHGVFDGRNLEKPVTRKEVAAMFGRLIKKNNLK